MAADFISYAEIATRIAPFHSMRQNPTPPGAKLCKQMRQFVSQCAIDFIHAVVADSRIQRDQLFAIIGAPGGSLKARIPFHANFTRKFFHTQRMQKFARFEFKNDIPSGGLTQRGIALIPTLSLRERGTTKSPGEGISVRKRELELPKQPHTRRALSLSGARKYARSRLQLH
jgi:hypothetical protein